MIWRFYTAWVLFIFTSMNFVGKYLLLFKSNGFKTSLVHICILIWFGGTKEYCFR